MRNIKVYCNRYPKGIDYPALYSGSTFCEQCNHFIKKENFIIAIYNKSLSWIKRCFTLSFLMLLICPICPAIWFIYTAFGWKAFLFLGLLGLAYLWIHLAICLDE